METAPFEFVTLVFSLGCNLTEDMKISKQLDKDAWTYLKRDVRRRAQSTKRGSRKLLGHHWGLWEVRGPRPRHCDRAQGLGPRDSPHTSLYTFSAPSSPPSEISRSMCLSLLSPLRLLSFSLALCASPVLDTEPLSAGVPVMHSALSGLRV